MALCRNARIRLVTRLQADKSLTHATRAVGRVIIMNFLDMRSGRAVVGYEKIAEAAGCDRASVARALPKLVRYIQVHRQHKDRPGRNGGWVRARDVNIYMVCLPQAEAQDVASSHKAHPATGSTHNISIQGRERVIHSSVDLLQGLNLEGLTRTDRLIVRRVLRQSLEATH